MKLLNMANRSSICSPEYQQILDGIVQYILWATQDDRLPQLTPEQVHHWLTNTQLEDVKLAFRDLRRSAATKIG